MTKRLSTADTIAAQLERVQGEIVLQVERGDVLMDFFYPEQAARRAALSADPLWIELKDRVYELIRREHHMMPSHVTVVCRVLDGDSVSLKDGELIRGYWKQYGHLPPMPEPEFEDYD